MNHCFHVYTPRKDKVLSGWPIPCIGWLALSLRVEVECVNLKRLRVAVQVQQSCTLSKCSLFGVSYFAPDWKAFVSTSNNIFVQYKNWLLISHWHHYFNFYFYVWLLLFYLFILLFLIAGHICQSIWPIYQYDLTAMSEMNPCTV